MLHRASCHSNLTSGTCVPEAAWSRSSLPLLGVSSLSEEENPEFPSSQARQTQGFLGQEPWTSGFAPPPHSAPLSGLWASPSSTVNIESLMEANTHSAVQKSAPGFQSNPKILQHEVPAQPFIPLFSQKYQEKLPETCVRGDWEQSEVTLLHNSTSC